MKKLNSLMYLIYYLLLWVVLPSTGLGEQVFAREFGDRDFHSVTKGDTNFSDFHLGVTPDWNKVTRFDSRHDGLLGTGHWPILFSSVFKPEFRFSNEEILNTSFTQAPILGALTTSVIIFPFHYFW